MPKNGVIKKHRLKQANFLIYEKEEYRAGIQ